jgi:hypothetical protein
MLSILRLSVGLLPCFLRSRKDLPLEILALRQQLAVLNRNGLRPSPEVLTKYFGLF